MDTDLGFNARLPGSGYGGVWSLHFSTPPHTSFGDWRNTFSILTLLPHPITAPPPPYWALLIPQTHADGQEYLFSGNQHWWLFCKWPHLSTYPNQCSDSIIMILICERRRVQPREVEGLPQELTTARPLMRVVSLHTAPIHWLLSCPSEQGLHLLCPDCEPPTPGVCISTRVSSFISTSAHLPETPFHLGSSSQGQ